MDLIKKLGTYFIVILMIITSSSFSYAASNSYDRNDKVDILNSVSILRGNGNSYNLDSQLKRSEAATFIVRLIGEEEKVIRNKSAYSDTSFIDVDNTDWFAPYVGYCSEMGIINGYGGNTFKPNDYVSEKAFLKMVLTALGYDYNVDFDWNNVYKTAYEISIVKDSRYSSKVEDNINYTRGDVIGVLYEALKTEHKELKTRMIQKFIDKLLLTKDTAKEYGLIEDDVETSVDLIQPLNESIIEVTFNEEIKEFSSDNLLIYEKNNASNMLLVKEIIKQQEKTKYAILLENTQESDEEYSIRLSGIIDNYGNKADTITLDFLGYRPDEVKSDYFKISKIEAISNNLLYLYFTQPINDNALQSTFYTLKKMNANVVSGSSTSMQISKLSTCNNGISIYFKNFVFNDENVWQLDIDGKITSEYGVQLKDGEGDSIKFNAVLKDNEAFNLDEIDTLSKNTVELTFTKVVNPVIAEQVFSYYITTKSGTPIQVTTASVGEDGTTVRLTVSTNFIYKDEYNIMINNINDISRQFYITEKQFSFTALYLNMSNVKVDEVIPLDANRIIAHINRPLDYETATIATNYQLCGITNQSFVAVPSAIYYDKAFDENLITIYLPKNKALESNKKYQLKLMTNLKDEMGNSQSAIEKYTFTHNSSKVMDTYIKESKIVGENTIKLEFNKEIALDITNVLNTNYKLAYDDNGVTYTKTPIVANYINPSTIILRFDLLDVDQQYTITFDKLVDYGKVETNNTTGKYTSEVLIGQ